MWELVACLAAAVWKDIVIVWIIVCLVFAALVARFVWQMIFDDDDEWEGKRHSR